MPKSESTAYVENFEGQLRVAGTRVSLGSIVARFLEGSTAEAIAESFPTVPLEKIYGAVAYYLAHRDEVDSHLAQVREEYEEARTEDRKTEPAFVQRLRDARLRMAS